MGGNMAGSCTLAATAHTRSKAGWTAALCAVALLAVPRLNPARAADNSDAARLIVRVAPGPIPGVEHTGRAFGGPFGRELSPHDELVVHMPAAGEARVEQ